MPIYEYECEKCGTRFEQFCRIKGDEKEVRCPECGADKPKKVISTFSRNYSNESCGTRVSG